MEAIIKIKLEVDQFVELKNDGCWDEFIYYYLSDKEAKIPVKLLLNC